MAGSLDPSFGTGGHSPDLGGSGAAVAVDPLGRVVVVGAVAGPGGHDFFVTRLLADGTPDPAFGTGGRAAVDFAGGDDVGTAVALDAAGRVVVAGTSTAGGVAQFAVARLTAAGAPDAAFAGGGAVAFHIAAGASDTAYGVAVDPADSGVVVAGSSTAAGTERFAVARLTEAGAPDAGFAGGGVTTFPVVGAPTERAYAVSLDPARRIVLAGYTFSTAPAAMQAAVVRLTPAGTPDAAFAGGGAVSIPQMSQARAVDTDATGNVFVAGFQFVLGTNLVVAEMTPAGAPAPGFGTAGSVSFTGTGPGITRLLSGSGIAVQADGKVVVTANDSGPGGTVLRLNADGTTDQTFGGRTRPGRVVITNSSAERVALSGVALAPDGRIVVAGTASDELGTAARLTAVTHLPPLAASGPKDGAAVLFPANLTTGLYPTTPAATVAPFGGVAANVRTAVADVDTDSIPDTILVTGPGTPIRVAVISGADNRTVLVAPFDPFGGNFSGGGYVAAADLDGDGLAEFIVTPDEGGGPRVIVFSRNPDGTTAVRANFLGIDDANFRGGARAALGDVSGDGDPDVIVTAGFGGGPRTAIFGGPSVLAGAPARLVNDFFAFPGADAATLRNGVFVAAGDVTGDGRSDLIFGGGPGGAPRVLILSGVLVGAGDAAGAQAAPVSNYFVAGNTTDRGGARVAATDADGDGRADVAVGSGAGRPARVRVYLGKDFAGGGEPPAVDLGVFGGTVLADGVYVG